jgi:ferredoxin
MSHRSTTRRSFLTQFLVPWRALPSTERSADLPAPAKAGPAGPIEPLASTTPVVAIVQGRHCLAYQRSFCSTCVERCPVPGAITLEGGLPRVNPDLCTGCRVCHDLCPAPRNAILLVPRRTPAAASPEAGNAAA